MCVFFFFFQAEDGIRDWSVTGVQTCALPISGCYGHNGADDVAMDAALVARATGGRPVKLQWMRDDEFQWEPYGSAMVMKLSGGLDAQGNVVGWTHDVWSHPHNNRPGAAGGGKLLASWHLEKPSKAPLPVDPPQPALGGGRHS